MTTESERSSGASPVQPLWTRVLKRPSTRLGWWAVALAAIFLTLFGVIVIGADSVPVDAPWRQTFFLSYVIVMVLTGLTAGIAGLLAVLRRRERSWLVWLAILVGLFVLALAAGEILEYMMFISE